MILFPLRICYYIFGCPHHHPSSGTVFVYSILLATALCSSLFYSRPFAKILKHTNGRTDGRSVTSNFVRIRSQNRISARRELVVLLLCPLQAMLHLCRSKIYLALMTKTIWPKYSWPEQDHQRCIDRCNIVVGKHCGSPSLEEDMAAVEEAKASPEKEEHIELQRESTF